MAAPAARRPPAVVYPLRRSRVLGLVLAALLVAGGAGLLGWGLQGAQSAIPQATVWGAAGLWILSVSSALHFWWHQVLGFLRWDGQCWMLEPDQAGAAVFALSGAPQVLVDLQSRLWVCVRFLSGGYAWLWLERSSQPERWLDLRRAVYSRARPGADNTDETAPASASRHGRES